MASALVDMLNRVIADDDSAVLDLGNSTLKVNNVAPSTGTTVDFGDSSIDSAETIQAVTATVGGATTGLISERTTFAVVTSDNVDKQITLPDCHVGKQVCILTGATGCELIGGVATHKINTVLVGATNELALAASCFYVCRYVATDNWVVYGWTLLGAPLGATTAALTTLTIGDAAGTPDYDITAVTQTTPFGFANAAELISVLYVIKNLQQRVGQLETGAKLTPDAL